MTQALYAHVNNKIKKKRCKVLSALSWGDWWLIGHGWWEALRTAHVFLTFPERPACPQAETLCFCAWTCVFVKSSPSCLETHLRLCTETESRTVNYGKVLLQAPAKLTIPKWTHPKENMFFLKDSHSPKKGSEMYETKLLLSKTMNHLQFSQRTITSCL
jgi:hypothetical protein